MTTNKLKKLVSPEAVAREPEKHIAVPKEVSVLPVRDTVLFPNAVLPLTIGRESSIALVQALGEEKLLAVVAQRDSRVDDPEPADLYEVGTLALVHKVIRMPNQSLFIFAEGLRRILRGEWGLEVKVGVRRQTLAHAFTHFRITQHVFECEWQNGTVKRDPAIKWVRPSELKNYPMGKTDRQIAKWLIRDA